METYIVYFDEAGDDGITTDSSNFFLLTSVYMRAEKWQENYEKIVAFRKNLKDEFGMHISEEFHTKHLLSDKDPYRKYHWTAEQRRTIMAEFAGCIAKLDLKVVNVIIDKDNVAKLGNESYSVLTNALKYNIQRIENDSNGKWNYLVITDKGRIAPMRKTARAIRVYNPIPSQFGGTSTNRPIRNLIEDILEKDSQESFFIQICDYISYVVHLYYKLTYKKEPLPNRVGRVIEVDHVMKIMDFLKSKNILNLKASSSNEYGLVIYPR